jgi:hypothetical protein
MPQLTCEQWRRVQAGEVVVIESNITDYNAAGQTSGDSINVNFSPTPEQVRRLCEEGRILYEIDAEVHGPVGKGYTSNPAAIAVRLPGH